MSKFCITSQKQSLNIARFSVHSVNNSTEEFSKAIDFVLSGRKEDRAQYIREHVSTPRTCLELAVN